MAGRKSTGSIEHRMKIPRAGKGLSGREVLHGYKRCIGFNAKNGFMMLFLLSPKIDPATFSENVLVRFVLRGVTPGVLSAVTARWGVHFATMESREYENMYLLVVVSGAPVDGFTCSGSGVDRDQ